MATLFERKVKLHDANGRMTEIKLEITDRNGYLEFTASNEYGQGQDSIIPRTEAQKELLDIWNTFHLNGMHSGTPEQEEAIKNKGGLTSYESKVEYLKLIGLYSVEHNGREHKYGGGWLLEPLSDNFIEIVLEPVCDELDAEEEEYNNNPITEEMITDQRIIDKADELDTTVEKLMAMYLFTEMSINAIDNIDHSYGNYFSIEGQEYLVCTDEEADDAHEESMDNYIEECILPELNERYRMYFDNDAWKKNVRGDGRGNALSSYDGNEDSIHVAGTDFYFYKN